MDFSAGDDELPSVDDLTVVAEIAEAELRQLELVRAAQEAHRVRTQHEKQRPKPKASKDSVIVSCTCENGSVRVSLDVSAKVRNCFLPARELFLNPPLGRLGSATEHDGRILHAEQPKLFLKMGSCSTARVVSMFEFQGSMACGPKFRDRAAVALIGYTQSETKKYADNIFTQADKPSAGKISAEDVEMAGSQQ